MPLEYYHNTQLLFTVDPLYRQLTTASPSTLLDIKKLQKHDANLLKKARLLSKNTTPPAKPPKAAEAHHILQQHIPRRCPQYPYTNYTMPLEYYHNTQLLFTVDPL